MAQYENIIIFSLHAWRLILLLRTQKCIIIFLPQTSCIILQIYLSKFRQGFYPEGLIPLVLFQLPKVPYSVNLKPFHIHLWNFLIAEPLITGRSSDVSGPGEDVLVRFHSTNLLQPHHHPTEKTFVPMLWVDRSEPHLNHSGLLTINFVNERVVLCCHPFHHLLSQFTHPIKEGAFFRISFLERVECVVFGEYSCSYLIFFLVKVSEGESSVEKLISEEPVNTFPIQMTLRSLLRK